MRSAVQASGSALVRVRPALDALTSVRFFAALYVAIFHWAKPHPHPKWPAPVKNVALAGYIGVPMFFVLSGFILSYNYAPQKDERIDKRGFWVARFARVYPVYLLGLFIAVPFFLEDLSKAGVLDVRHVGLIGGTATTLTQAWSPSTACKWNCPGWTLSVETLFYLVFPFLLVPIVMLSVRGLLALAAGSWLVALTGPTYVALGLPAHEKLDFYVSMTPISRLPEFVIGMALGLIFLRLVTTNRQGQVRRTVTVVTGAATLVLAGSIVASSRIPEILLRTSLVTPLFAVIIFGLALNTGGFQRTMSSPVLVLLGEASYALYIIHQPILSYLDHGGRSLVGHPVGAEAEFGVVYLTVAVATSLVVLRLYEQPVRRFIRSRLAMRVEPSAKPGA
jgi:peptidoglycan/LPS O-acetylase OafA/YrhL